LPRFPRNTPFALEPRRIAGRDDFCLYEFRGGRSIETKQLVPPVYLPPYREWEWYRKPLAEQRSIWSEPYVDVGAGNIRMATFSSPIRRDDAVAGVLTFD
jgi:hypothetical protein